MLGFDALARLALAQTVARIVTIHAAAGLSSGTATAYAVGETSEAVPVEIAGLVAGVATAFAAGQRVTPLTGLSRGAAVALAGSRTIGQIAGFAAGQATAFAVPDWFLFAEDASDLMIVTNDGRFDMAALAENRIMAVPEEDREPEIPDEDTTMKPIARVRAA